jgi:hypothetical protein
LQPVREDLTTDERLERIEAGLAEILDTLQEYRPLLERARDRFEGRRWSGLRTPREGS